jgi:hypothetical protein
MCAKDVIPTTSRRMLLIWPKSIKNKRFYSIPSKKGKFEGICTCWNITKRKDVLDKTAKCCGFNLQ